MSAAQRSADRDAAFDAKLAAWRRRTLAAAQAPAAATLERVYSLLGGRARAETVTDATALNPANDLAPGTTGCQAPSVASAASAGTRPNTGMA